MDSIDRVPVVSSLIEEIGHKDNTLEVKFRNGGTYRYDNVPAALHSEMMDADSVGSFFLKRIKTATNEDGEPLFPFSRVKEDR